VTASASGGRIRLSSDYDARRWIAIPDPALVDVDVWSRDVSHAWAQDLGRLDDHNWADILRSILELTISRTYEGDPDRIFVHLLTPPHQAPSPVATFVAVRPANGTLDELVRELVDDEPAAVEPPTAEPISRGARRAHVLTLSRRGAENVITTALRVVWEIAPEVVAVVTASGTNAGRILVMREDMVQLAGGLALLPDDPQ
jgi:hypothetical protein